MDLNLYSVRCFLAVAEEGSISSAARQLHMSQPPLSVRVRALERELGVDLLIRRGRGVELTASGRVLVERGRRLLADAESAADAIRAVGSGVRGRLELAVGSTVAPSLLADLLGQLRLEAPEVQIDAADTPADEVRDRVGHGRSDVGLLHLGPLESGQADNRRGATIGEHGLEVAVVEREPLVVVLPEGHSEASGERANLAALTDEVLIAVARTRVPGLFEHAMAAWSAVEGDPARTREAGTPTTVMALVQAGFGVAVMPQALAVEASEKLSVRPLRQHRPAVETAIVWHPSNRSPVLARFLRIALSTPEPDVLGPERARSSRPVPERRWPGLQG